MATDVNARRWQILARSAANTRREVDAPRFPIQLHRGVLLRKYRISRLISDGKRSAALRLAKKVASRKEASGLVDYLLKNRTAITLLGNWPKWKHHVLDKVLAQLVLEFGLYEVSSSATGERSGLDTLATWLEHATFVSDGGNRQHGRAVFPLCRTLSALLESGPDLSGQHSHLAGGIYFHLVPGFIMWFYEDPPFGYEQDEIVPGLLFPLLKLAGPLWTLCPATLLCISPMLPILQKVRPWRLYEISSIMGLGMILGGFIPMMFGLCVLPPGWTIPEFRFADLLDIISDLLSGVPAQLDTEQFFRNTLSLFFRDLCGLQDSEHQANSRHLIKLVVWFATFLPRHDDYSSFDEQTLKQVEHMYPTLVRKIRQPLSLKQNCAITIRRQLGFKRLRQISQLGPLPPGMDIFLEKGFFQVDDALVNSMASERLS